MTYRSDLYTTIETINSLFFSDTSDCSATKIHGLYDDQKTENTVFGGEAINYLNPQTLGLGMMELKILPKL